MPLLRATRDFVLGRKGLGRLWSALPRGWRIVALAVAGWLVVVLLLLLALLVVRLLA